jgi:hypothetical protein
VTIASIWITNLLRESEKISVLNLSLNNPLGSSLSSPTSIFTLRRGREFLENLIVSGQLLNFSEINQIAFLAQEISQDALDQVSN